MRVFGIALLVCFANFSEASALPLPSPNSIPFEYSEGVLWVQIQVPHSARPLNFLFDTGAEISTINAETTQRLGLTGGFPIWVQGVQSTKTGRWPVILTAKAGSLRLPSKYLSLDLSQLANSCRRPLDGLLGADCLQGKVTQIDFQSHLIRFGDRIPAADSDIILPMKLHNHCFCVPICVNHQPQQWLRLDTGCATALQWVTSGAEYSTQARKPAIGLTSLSIPQTQTTVSLGARQFDQIPTGLHHRVIFAGEGGLLGNDFLNRFKAVTIDTKSCRVVLTPL
jgi:predicted aspartyl protease